MRANHKPNFCRAIMRDDLLDAQASVDWADAQLPTFVSRIESWISYNIEISIEELPPPSTDDRVIAIQKGRFPLTFNVEFGAYVNAIRSSLDILATSLAARYSACPPEDAYFPIAKSEAAFKAGKYRGSKLVNRLPPIERAIIESLKPYNGGNDPLYTLHHLDIQRKHRRLIDMQLATRGAVTPGFDHFAPTEPLRVDDKTILGLVRKDVPHGQFKMAPKIAFNVVDPAAPKSVISDLHQFAGLARSIINLFDTP